MATARTIALAFLFLFLVFAFAPGLAAQSQSAAALHETGFSLYETFGGSGNSDGLVTDLNSTVGYRFSKHFGVDVGVPVYFIHAPSSKPGTSSSNQMGNPYADLRWTFKNPSVNYSSTLNGAVPTADTKKGLSTGRMTFDWDNHFDRAFGRLTPFADAGVGNSISDSRFFKRPFITLGKLAHFEAGTEVDIWGPLSLSASAYDVLPWGQQNVFSRLVRRGAAGSGTVKHGRVFENSAQTTGGASLVRDNGVNVGLDLSPTPFMDLSLGYSHSVHFALDTISFSVGLNLSSIFSTTRGK